LLLDEVFDGETPDGYWLGFQTNEAVRRRG